MDKEDVVHIYYGMLAIKMNEIMPFAATWMDLEIIVLSEVSQTEKDKYITYMRNLLKNDINELFYKTETDSQRTNLRLPGWGREEEGLIGSFGLTCTLCYI